MDHNIGLMLEKRAHLNPNLEGCVETESGRRFTYAELDARCNKTANMLSDQGVKPGDRVALLMMNGVEFMESFFAIAKIGAVCVPLNWRLTPDELCFILKDSGAKTLVFSSDFAEAVEDIHGRGSDATDISRWISVGERTAIADDYDALHDAASDSRPAIGANEDDMLFIMYTSGTTGLPKGAVHTHNSTLWGSLTSLATSDMQQKDRYLLVLPLFHVGALSPLIACVHGGGTSVIMRGFDLDAMWTNIEAEKITTMLAVPAMLNFMLLSPAKDTADYSSLRWVMSGAAPVPVTLIETYAGMGIEIHQVYGLTETCGPSCLISPDDAMAKAGSTGKAFFHTNVRVVDSDGNDIKAGEVGEVLVSGKHIMKEYWNRADATSETIVDGWLHTGDLATVDEDGFVYIQDRIKDMIISGGENIYPAEIENVLLAHPKIQDCAVIGQQNQQWGEVCLAVVVREDDSLTEADVMKHCDGKLARYKLPKGVEFIDAIPRNPTGKALKRILRDQFPGEEAKAS
ncbi:MAG: o-succinylbenzoate--CoA ligase [Rhodobiaceae bacterium]|nr:o-succinylbenzoate--CoA ligase [Rhodobiaceae bacterium]